MDTLAPSAPSSDALELIEFSGLRARRLFGAPESHGSLTALEIVVAPAAGAPLHISRHEDKFFRVLAGNFRFRSGEQEEILSPGTSRLVRRGLAHAFTNVSREPAELLLLSTPAGHDEFFRAMAALPVPHEPAAVAELCRRYDQELLPESGSVPPSRSNLETVRELYRCFRAQDEDGLRALCAPDVEWIQCPGFPGGAVRRGVEEVLAGVFRANRVNWRDFAYEIDAMLDAGSSVVVTGHYSGSHHVSGRGMRAAAAHVYDLRAGRIERFRMFADTQPMWQAMMPEPGA